MASQTSGIAWTATTNEGWISFNPTTGTGSQSIQISVIPASSYTDKTSGTITITSDKGQSTSISVTRCVIPVCDEDYNPKNQTVYIDECGGSYDFTITHTLADCSEEEIPVSGSVGMNCEGERTVKELIHNGTVIYRVIQKGGCQDPDCFGSCQCTSAATQQTPYPTVDGTGGTVTITWDITYPNCENPNCHETTESESVKVPCNTGAARTYSDTSSYGTWRVSQGAGTPQGCGECICSCSDFSNFQVYTVPAEPTSRVKLYSFQATTGCNGGKEIGHGTAFYFSDNRIFHDISGSSGYEDDKEVIGDTVYHTIYVNSNKVNANSSTASTSTTLYIKPYVCSDTTYFGNANITDGTACDVKTFTITQEGKAVTYCDCYKDIVVSPVTASSYSDTSATITWTYTHRKADGTTETGSSSTPVSFEANDTTSMVTRTGSTTWTNHKLCDGNDCGDNAVINWEVSVPGKPEEPDFSTYISFYDSTTEGIYPGDCIITSNDNPTYIKQIHGETHGFAIAANINRTSEVNVEFYGFAVTPSSESDRSYAKFFVDDNTLNTVTDVVGMTPNGAHSWLDENEVSAQPCGDNRYCWVGYGMYKIILSDDVAIKVNISYRQNYS